MTALELFRDALIDLNKKGAPNLLLEDYCYYINRAINQYYNKAFNSFEVNNVATDELRVLKASCSLDLSVILNDSYNLNVYNAYLPDDYLHLLNCTVVYDVLKDCRSYDQGSTFEIGVNRLPSDAYPTIINDYYRKPSYRNPYYYIINDATDILYPISEEPTKVYSSDSDTVNSKIVIGLGTCVAAETITLANTNATNTVFSYQSSPITTEAQYSGITTLADAMTSAGYNVSILSSSDSTAKAIVINQSSSESITSVICSNSNHSITYSKSLSGQSFKERTAGNRYGNKTRVKMQFMYGKDASVFKPEKLKVQYMRTPQYIRLTQAQVDSVTDISQVLEFPDQICYEILKEFVSLIMEHNSDPRLQTYIPITTSIAQPQGEQQQEVAQQRKR